jgi:3-oxoacyl-[acyl-carrier protein] reductase
LSQIPSGRLGTTKEVAKAVKYLCSEEAAYLSGITLNINGGMHFNS